MTFKDWTEEKLEKHFELARRGKLRQILTKGQKRLYDLHHSNQHSEIGIVAARKVGKTWTCLVIAYEHCIRYPRHTVSFVLPSLKECREVVLPIANEFKDIIPEDLLPRVWKSTLTLEFSNGSSIKLGGMAPEVIDANRGGARNLIIFDEVAFSDPEVFLYGLNSIFKPMTTLTGGKIIYATTQPRDVDHPFVTNIVPALISKHALEKLTIYDNELLDPTRIAEIAESLGGYDSKDFLREQMAELIPDDSLRLIPEFDDGLHILDEIPPKEDFFGNLTKYVGYVSADVGLNDNTAILWGYLDHNTQKLIILEEWVDNYKTLKTIAEAWTEGITQFLPHCIDIVGTVDVFDIAAHELRIEYGLSFQRPTKGRRLEDTIAFLRNAFENDKIQVSPSCPRLIYELKTAIWNEKRKAVARNEEQSHADAIMALAYLVKKVDWSRRPGVSRVNLVLGKKTERKKPGDIKERLRNLR